jgi:hypothetical protein
MVLLGFLILTLSCDEGIMDSNNEFRMFGRVVCKPIPAESCAEFFLFNFDNAITDAIVVIGLDTVALVDSSSGYYYSQMLMEIGDTISYSISSDFGAQNGQVIIPDTVSIIHPQIFDTINFGEDFDVSWIRGINADGYFIYLENQERFVAEIAESYFDTSITVSGMEMQNPGVDRLWVEAISGNYEVARTPFNALMPKGVVGAAGNYRDVEIVL